MNKTSRNIIIGLAFFIVIILVLFVLLPNLERIPYYALAFSSTCAEKCSKENFNSAQCVEFPSLWLANKSPCGEGGIDKGSTSDCRSFPGKVGGSSLQCCCYK